MIEAFVGEQRRHSKVVRQRDCNKIKRLKGEVRRKPSIYTSRLNVLLYYAISKLERE
jgi:hypothetical protein